MMVNRFRGRRFGRVLAASLGALAALATSSLSACSEGGGTPPTAAPRTGITPPAASEALSSASLSTSLIQLIEIERAQVSPNTIDPCWLVNRSIYLASQRIDGITAEFTFTYTSFGRTVTKNFVEQVRDGIVEEPLPGQATNLIRLTNGLDVGFEVPDADSPIRGLLQLVMTSGRTRVVLAQSTLTELPDR